MNWFARLFPGSAGAAAEEARWVVVDCESSGLDPHADRLLSIGAVAVRGGRIAIDDGFSVVLRQDTPSENRNIEVHGISGTEQLEGVDRLEALRRFADYAADDALVAFHAPFDRALLARAERTAGLRIRNRWLDLAKLAPVLYPAQAARRRSLDDWLDLFGIENPARHDALGDAYASAQLFQILLVASRAQGVRSAAEVLKAADAGRWLAP